MGLGARFKEAKNRLVGHPVHHALERYGPLLDAINAHAPNLLTLDEDALKRRTLELGDQIRTESSESDELETIMQLYIDRTHFTVAGSRRVWRFITPEVERV